MTIGQIILIIISGLGIFHGLFLSILLWGTRNTGNISNKILALLMIVLSLRVGKSVLLAFTSSLEIVYVYLGLCLMLFIGPLFLLYCKAVLNRKQMISRKDWLHFLPAVVFIALAAPFQQIGFRNLPTAIAVSLFIVFYLHFLIYLLYVKLTTIRKSISGEIKTWLTILFYGLLAIWLEYVLNLFEDSIPYILGPIVYSITVYYITYLAYSKKYLSAINTVKYQSTQISDDEVKQLYASIENLMRDESLFLDSNLFLAQVARRLKVSSQKISLAVNSKSGSNFNEYLNRYRVEHAKKILKDSGFSNLSIAAIAYDCGFNSLSSFNTSFKKLTGKTPSAFRNAEPW